MKVKCYWSYDGSCNNDAEWICPECARALCEECQREETDELDGRCGGICLERVPHMVDIGLVYKWFLKKANKNKTI
jgi:hypothetical protein